MKALPLFTRLLVGLAITTQAALALEKPDANLQIFAADKQGGTGEWVDNGENARLRSYRPLGDAAGVSALTISAKTDDFDKYIEFEKIDFTLDFRDQRPEKVRPTVRIMAVRRIMQKGKPVDDPVVFEVAWPKYVVHTAGSNAECTIDVRKMLDEGRQLRGDRCRVKSIAIGGREISRSGLGNNAGLDVTVRNLRMIARCLDAEKVPGEPLYHVVPKKLTTVKLVSGDDPLIKDLNGTI